METEVRGDGESQGAEGKKEIGRSGDRCFPPFGQGFNTGQKRPLDGAASSESDGRAEKETGWESEEKTKSLAGTPGSTRSGDESAMGGEAGLD